MLTEYNGPSNHREIFKYLVGETIAAAFISDDGRVVIVCSSGAAIQLGSCGVDGGSPVYWKVDAEDLKRMIDNRRRDIERNLDELRDLPGVALP